MEKNIKDIDYEALILKYLDSYKHKYGKKKTLILVNDILARNPINNLPSYLQNIDPAIMGTQLSKILINAMQNNQQEDQDISQLLFQTLKDKKIQDKKTKKKKPKEKKIREKKAKEKNSTKKSKSSILDKRSFIKRPIKKVFLIGAIALTSLIFSKDEKQNIESSVSVQTTVCVKNLEVGNSELLKNEDYTLNKVKKEMPVITINKGIEKEHTEDEYQEEKKRIKFINYYARVYNLNKKKVRKIIKKDTKLLSYKSINKKIDNKELEFKILNIVKDINESEYTYQKSYGNIREYTYKKKKTYREMVRHYANLYGIDANKALAIEFLESGYYERPIATVKHNPGSKRRKDGEYFTYPNMEQGIIEHMITLCNYKGQSIEGMAARYCSVEGAAGWSGQVRPIYNSLQKNPNYYTLVDERGSQKKKVR